MENAFNLKRIALPFRTECLLAINFQWMLTAKRFKGSPIRFIFFFGFLVVCGCSFPAFKAKIKQKPRLKHTNSKEIVITEYKEHRNMIKCCVLRFSELDFNNLLSKAKIDGISHFVS